MDATPLIFAKRQPVTEYDIDVIYSDDKNFVAMSAEDWLKIVVILKETTRLTTKITTRPPGK